MGRSFAIAIVLGLLGACGAFGSSSTEPDAENPSDGGADGADGDALDSGAGSGDTSPPIDGSVLGPHYVFVTSTSFPGDEVSDQKCVQAAAGPLAGRKFVAWVSYSATSARKRLVEYGPWSLVDDTQVAQSLDNLKGLERPIDRDEKGMKVSDYVWTGTDATLAGDQNCGDWKIGDAGPIGRIGSTLSNDGQWTALKYESCDKSYRVYCFEQP